MITKSQKAIIHIAAQQLGWNDDTYRDILRAHAGVTSSNDLDYKGFRSIMRHAEKCGFQKSQNNCQKPATRKYDHLGHRFGFATPAQLRKIEAMWRTAARDPSDRALRHFLENRFGASRMEWVTEDMVTGILRTLERMTGTKHENRCAK